MKRSVSVLAEIMALPFSDLFLEHDPIKESVKKAQITNTSIKRREQISCFAKSLDTLGISLLQQLSIHLDISNSDEFQALLHYVYRAEDIINCAIQFPSLSDTTAIVNQYYFLQLNKIAKTFLTNRSGKATLKSWEGSISSFHVFNNLSCKDRGYEKPGSEHNQYFAPQQIEAWHSILQCIPEDMIISNYAALLSQEDKYAQKRNTCFRILKSFGDTVNMADSLLDRALSKGMAETHIHAGASRSFGIIWESMLESALKMQSVLEKEEGYSLQFKTALAEIDVRKILREAGVVRLLLAAYLQSGHRSLVDYLMANTPSMLSMRCQSHFISQASAVALYGSPKCKFCDVVLPFEPFLMNYPRRDAYDLWTVLQLPKEMQLSMPTLAERCFMSWSFQQIADYPEDTVFTALFLYYLRLKTYAYRCRVQDNKSKGLSYFQQYYSYSTDTGNLNEQEIFTQIFYTALQDPRVIKTEFRLSPPSVNTFSTIKHSSVAIKQEISKTILSFIKQHLFTLILMYGNSTQGRTSLQEQFNREWRMSAAQIHAHHDSVLKSLMLRFNVTLEKIPSHRIGIIYHLIKRGEKYEQDSCFARKDESSEIDSYTKFSFGKARFHYAAAISAISDVRDICPAISRLIVGIDAASLEIPTDPWVFAPAFAEARKRNAILSHNGNLTEKKSLLGITYHVGEDFRHPLSGLRHVDEAIQYLKMRSGDRIGHGLALGIDVPRWFQMHGLIALSHIEWLENMIWIWHLITSGFAPNSISKYSNYVESQIMQTAFQIYGSLNGITIDGLYQSYKNKARRTEYIQAIAATFQHACDGNYDCFQATETPTLFPCASKSNAFNNSVWTEELLSLSYHCSFYKAKMNKPILVIPTSEQAELAVDLQHYLREKIAKIGLIVESNPSSNTVIGEINGVLQHPVGDLRNSSFESVMASINTDDPSVFNASVANEHAQIYYSLRYKGHSIEKSLKMVDELRDIGLRTSFIDDVVPFDRLLKEYEEIVREIRI